MIHLISLCLTTNAGIERKKGYGKSGCPRIPCPTTKAGIERKKVMEKVGVQGSQGSWKSDFQDMIGRGTPEYLVRLMPARKIASIPLALWKKGECYDEKKMKFKHAA
jgi:hypothetical protein